MQLDALYINVETSDLAKAQELTNFVSALNARHFTLNQENNLDDKLVNFVLPKQVKSITIKF